MRTLIKLIVFLIIVPGLNAQEVFETEKLPFSSGLYDEYAPTPWEDGLVYVANYRLDFFYTFNNDDQKAPWGMFFVKQRSSGTWSEPKIWETELKTNANDGPVTFEGETKIYFSQNYNAPTGLGNVRDQERVGIFTAELIDRRWREITPFEHNDERYSTMHPSLSPNGRFLFFSSNRRGGEGGYDIYVCTREGDSWSAPVNLGPLVNTSGHEIMPYYQSTGRLFFSSNRHPGLGRYDIYLTEKVENYWAAPMNLGEPFNSKRNDISFTADNTLTEGYFASNRDRFSASIYKFSLSAPEFEECEEQIAPNYCFTFFEEGTMDIDTTNYMYEWRVGNDRVRGQEARYCFKKPGPYIVQLNVIDMLTDSVMSNEATYDFLLEDEEQVYISSPDTVYVDETIHFGTHKTFLKNFEIDEYYWDMGDNLHRADTAIDHRYFKPGIYTIRCGATSVAETPEEVKKTCSSKRIIVLPKPDVAMREEVNYPGN